MDDFADSCLFVTQYLLYYCFNFDETFKIRPANSEICGEVFEIICGLVLETEKKNSSIFNTAFFFTYFLESTTAIKFGI